MNHPFAYVIGGPSQLVKCRVVDELWGVECQDSYIEGNAHFTHHYKDEDEQTQFTWATDPSQHQMDMAAMFAAADWGGLEEDED